MKTNRMFRRVAMAALAIVALLIVVAVAGYGVSGMVQALGLLTGVTVFGMVLDSRCEFCDATALSTAGTGLALVGNVMDLTLVTRNVGTPPRPLYLVIQVDTAVTSAGAATVSFILASDAQAAIAVDGSATQHFAGFAVPKATLVAGFTMVIPLPGSKPDYERFLGIIQNVGVAALTAGKINAFLTHDPKQWRAYDDGR